MNDREVMQQEPVAWMCSNPELMAKGYKRFSSRCEGDWNIPVYTAPPQQRKPLTQKEIFQWMDRAPRGLRTSDPDTIWLVAFEFAERAHGIEK